MNYEEEFSKVKKLIQNKEYVLAEEKLITILSEAKEKNIEDEDNTHYSFNNYIDFLIFWNLYKPEKENIVPDINYSQVYYNLGYINIEMRNFGKALEYLELGLKWNPVDVSIIFEIAAQYRMTGNIERFKAEIEKTYMYIYNSVYMAKYFRELGWYYSEKRIFDLANALYTHSISYKDTEIARNELLYIAEQEKRELKFSSKDEIYKLLTEYNIKSDFSKDITQIIYNDYNYLKENKPDASVIQFLLKTLYDITLDARFMIYNGLKDNEFGIEIKVPNTWKYLDKNAFEKFNISKNIAFLLLTSSNKNVSIVCVGKCTEEQLEEVYKKNIENMKNQGIIIVGEYNIKDKRTIKQVFLDTKKNDNTILRTFNNYLVVNNYLFNAYWEVSNNYKIEDLYNSVIKSFAMEVVYSIKAIQSNKDISQTSDSIVNTNQELKEYSLEIQDFPIFKFYLPKNLGQYTKTSSNVFELKKDNIQKIRVMITKCSSEENLEINAKKWIERNKKDAKMEDVSYRKEKIGNIPIEVYELKYIDKPKLVNKVYKLGYVSGYMITISGGKIKGKEEIINTAFEKLKWEETVKVKNENEPTIIDCPVCNNSFELKWSIPNTEKTFYCQCPNCGMELKRRNPNYIDENNNKK